MHQVSVMSLPVQYFSENDFSANVEEDLFLRNFLIQPQIIYIYNYYQIFKGEKELKYLTLHRISAT